MCMFYRISEYTTTFNILDAGYTTFGARSPFSRRLIFTITNCDDGNGWGRRIIDCDGLLSHGCDWLMLHIVTTAVLATMMMGLHWLLLPMAARRRRVSSHATGWCALFNPLLHRTQLLRLFLMFVSMLSLLWYRNVMLMVFGDGTLAPTL